jgi:hypothetical protein
MTTKKTTKTSTKPSKTVDVRRTADVKNVDEALNAAVQAKLVALAAKPVTPRSLMELEQMTRITRQMIAVSANPHNHHAHVPPTAYPTNLTSGLNDTSDVEDSTGTFPIQPYPLAPSPPAENFGATVVRELMTLLGTIKKPETSYPVPMPPLSETDRLIESIAYAREKGLEDVEKTLLKQLYLKMMNSQELPEPMEPLAPKKPKTTNGTHKHE